MKLSDEQKRNALTRSAAARAHKPTPSPIDWDKQIAELRDYLDTADRDERRRKQAQP